jgi:hypothetical protein
LKSIQVRGQVSIYTSRPFGKLSHVTPVVTDFVSSLLTSGREARQAVTKSTTIGTMAIIEGAPASPRAVAATQPSGLGLPVILTACVVLLGAAADWARRWILSGAAMHSLLVLYGYGYGSRVFPDIPLWTLLTSFNLLYAVCSTSWLLYGCFTVLCYPALLLTCLLQFETAAKIARKYLRLLLKQLHFTRDKIALFNLPALEIDTDVDGLFVIRGVTISLSTLTIVAHGIELGNA